MVIEENVYDVTRFLEEHPGGEDIMLDSSGRDASREFEDVGHSTDARAQLKELRIGTLRDPIPEEVAKAAEEAAVVASAKVSGSSLFNTVAKWLVPVFIIGAAFIISKYSK
jgi:cytochrome b5